MISDLDYAEARRALDGAVVVDPQPGDRAVVSNVADIIDCPECDRSRIDPVQVVYEGRWRCRFCGTQIRLAIGKDRRIVDPARGDLYVRVVRPGEPAPRPVPSSCLGAFRGDPWRPDWEPTEVVSRRQQVGLGGGVPVDPPDRSWIQFGQFGHPEFDSDLDTPAWVIGLVIGLTVLVVVLVLGAVVWV